jgi:hypothetical protein
MRIDESTRSPWTTAAAAREQEPQDYAAAAGQAAETADTWTGDEAFSASRAAARLAEEAAASALAATVDPAPVGGLSWLAEQGAALFEQGRPVLGMKDGLPIVAATEEEHAQGVAYLKEQFAKRGQDTENIEWITIRVPVSDGAMGPQVGWFQTTAAMLDTSNLKVLGPTELPENIASALRSLGRN